MRWKTVSIGALLLGAVLVWFLRSRDGAARGDRPQDNYRPVVRHQKSAGQLRDNLVRLVRYRELIREQLGESEEDDGREVSAPEVAEESETPVGPRYPALGAPRLQPESQVGFIVPFRANLADLESPPWIQAAQTVCQLTDTDADLVDLTHAWSWEQTGSALARLIQMENPERASSDFFELATFWDDLAAMQSEEDQAVLGGVLTELFTHGWVIPPLPHQTPREQQWRLLAGEGLRVRHELEAFLGTDNTNCVLQSGRLPVIFIPVRPDT